MSMQTAAHGCSSSLMHNCQNLEATSMSFSSVCVRAKSFQSCLTVQPCGLQPASLLCPWGAPGKNTAVGCHALLQVLLVDEWINKVQYLQPMGYYSALKGNELSGHEDTWRKLKCVLLNERSQSAKAIYFVSPTICHFGKGKTMPTIKRSVVIRGWEG